MVTPISNLNQSHPPAAPKPAATPKTQPTQQKSAPPHSDTVTLKSTGTGSRDGGSH